jgi:hypothetical protein
VTTLTELPVRLAGSGVRSGVTTTSEAAGGASLLGAGRAGRGVEDVRLLLEAGLDRVSGLTTTAGSCSGLD